MECSALSFIPSSISGVWMGKARRLLPILAILGHLCTKLTTTGRKYRGGTWEASKREMVSLDLERGPSFRLITRFLYCDVVWLEETVLCVQHRLIRSWEISLLLLALGTLVPVIELRRRRSASIAE